MTSLQTWWSLDAHARRRPWLLSRNRLKRALAVYFEADGFTEVEAAQLQRSPGNETHLHAFATDMRDPAGKGAPVYLHTSPEFACKKLLAAGETRIFDFARVFRNRERGVLHACEFTMLEWYRAGQAVETLMDDCAEILRIAADVGGKAHWSHRGRSIDPRALPERLTVAEAFARHAGVDLMATVTESNVDRDGLAAAAMHGGIRVAEDDSWSDVFSRVLVEKVEPALGNGRATVLHDYPWPEAALARRKPSDPRVAERFELYACGVELANAFGELTDPVEQRARFTADMDLKEAIYGERYPIDEELLAALAVMPEASGAALGFDRLVMLAVGADTVHDVLWTPPHDPFMDNP